VCRILLGALLFADVARRYKDLDAYYTNLGWLTNHFALFRPMASHVFSFYHAFSTPAEVRVLFFVHCAVNLLFLVGYRTRLTQFLALVLLCSINSRNIIIENGGFVMLTLLTLWSWVLPLGQRFSVDSWLTSWRSSPERTLEDLNDRSRPRLPVSPVVSLAITAIILQWAINYFLNTVHKDGPTWRDGSAIYYFVQQSRLLHPFGMWLKDHTPYVVLAWLTHSTLVLEGAIAFLWVSPFFPKLARMLAWVLGASLHFGILAFATLGPFVWIMMIPYAMFIPRELWDGVAARMRRGRARLVMFLDPQSPLSVSVGRVVKRLDTLELIRFAPARSNKVQSKLALALDLSPAPTKPSSSGRAAAVTLLGALPWPRACSRFVALVGGGWALETCLARLLSARAVWARRLGLDAPLPTLPPGGQNRPQASRARRAFQRIGFALGELLTVFLLIVSTSQVLMENRAVPVWMKPKSRPHWVEAMVVYGRLFQGWSMFSPDPPREDGWVVVDGRTKGGGKLDPLTGRAPDFSLSPRGGPDFSAQWEAFHMRIHEQRFSVFYPGFQDFLKNHHRLSGNPSEELVAFDVWYVGRYINPPGHGFSENFYRKLFGFGAVQDSGVPEAARRKADKPQSPQSAEQRGSGRPNGARARSNAPGGAPPSRRSTPSVPPP
jgi:hypothetical protein